jgi:hypothetical protein
MHGADQKACETGETVAQNSFIETNRFLFPTWIERRTLFFSFFSLISFFLFFSFLFLTYRTTEQGWGDREVAARRMCARGGGWMSSGDETRVTRKDGTKGRKHKCQQQFNA